MNKNPIIRKYGLMIGLVAVLIQIVATMFPYAEKIQYANVIIIPLGIIFACIEYSNSKDNNVTYGNLFSAGFFTGLIVTVFLVVSFILLNLLFPDLKQDALQQAQVQMSKDSRISQSQMENAMQMTEKYYTIFGIAGSLFWGLLLTIFGSFIGAAVAKKEPQD